MRTDADPFDLQRFETSQAGQFQAALTELRAGFKRSHWMWFIFPQLRGLGYSPMAERYGIGSLDEARAYLAHPLLGPRLDQCASTVMALRRTTPRAIFGVPDDVKFHSSMSLFALVAPDPKSPYHRALTRWFAGASDERTLARLAPTGALAQPAPTGALAQPAPTGALTQPAPTGALALRDPTGALCTADHG